MGCLRLHLDVWSRDVNSWTTLGHLPPETRFRGGSSRGWTASHPNRCQRQPHYDHRPPCDPGYRFVYFISLHFRMYRLKHATYAGAAMNTPTAVAMVSTTFPDPAEKSRAYAIYGAVGAVGNVSGFILGGVLTARLSWRWGK